MRPNVRAVLGWIAYAAVLGFLDGVPGMAAAVVVGVVFLAGLSRRVIGVVGVACLAAAPLAVVIAGIPTEASVSPKFVARSLWPHHLTFVGMALVCTAAVVDLAPRLRALRQSGVIHPEDADPAHATPFPGLPVAARWAIVVAVAVLMVVAGVGVVRA